MTDTPSEPSRPRRRRWPRRATRALLSLVILLGVVVLALELVRRSDLPRRFIASALQELTGLRVEVGSASVGWRGGTVLRDLVVRLPLDDTPLAEIPLVRARHTGLVAIPFTGFRLDGVVMERPVVAVHEDDLGRWNVLRAAGMIAAANAGPGAGPRPASPPRVEIMDGVVNLRRWRSPVVSLPLSMKGASRGVLAWELDVALGGIHVGGVLSTTTFEQDLRLEVADIDHVVRLWGPDAPMPIVVEASWRGERTDAGLTGRLAIRHAAAGDSTVAGGLGVGVRGGAVTLRPDALEFSVPKVGTVGIPSGLARVNGAEISWDRVRIEHAAVTAEVDGEWDLDRAHGVVAARWQPADAPDAPAHTGNAKVTIGLPGVGPGTVEAAIESSGEVAGRRWRARADLTARGRSWGEFDAELTMRSLGVWDAGRPTDLSGLSLGVEGSYPTVSLRSLTLPGARVVSADATVDVYTLAWDLALDIRDWTVPLATPREIDISVEAVGDDRRLRFSSLRVAAEEGVVEADGDYDPARPQPLRATARLGAPLPEGLRAAPGVVEPRLVADLHIRGSVDPLGLEGGGEIAAPALCIGAGVVGPVRIPLRLRATPETASVSTGPFALLGGEWSGNVECGLSTGDTEAGVRVAGASVGALAGLGVKDFLVTGALDAELEVRLPAFDVDRVEAEGAWRVRELASGGGPALRGAGKIGVRGSDVHVHDVLLDDAAGAGVKLTGGVSLNTRRAHQLRVDLEARGWPLAFEGSSLAFVLDSRLGLDIDIIDRTARGEADATVGVSLDGAHLATVTADTTVEGRTVTAGVLRIEGLEGVAEGTAVMPLDDWTKSTGRLEARGIGLAALKGFVPNLGDVTGTLSGVITAEHTDDPRALQPLRVQGELRTEGGSVRRIALGDISFDVFAGRERVILDRSSIGFAGGNVSVWSRLSRHGAESFVHLDVDAEALDLNEIVHALRPDLRRTPGRMALRASMGGYIAEPHRTFGEAVVNVTEADLQPVPAFSQLYALMHVEMKEPVPTGRGQARLRLENDTLVVSRIQYFNRGTDIIGAGRIVDVWAWSESEVRGGLAATARPLKDSGIPFSAQLDRMIFAAIHDAASVRLSGRLGAPAIEVVPFSDIAASIDSVFGTRSSE